MFTATKKVIILICALILASPLYAQNEVNQNNIEAEPLLEAESPPSEEHPIEISTSVPTNKLTTKTFFDFIDKKAYADTIDEKEERKILREKWKKLLGLDIFYPYFKAKEVESWVRKKASVRIFNIRGRPKFENNSIKYTFKIKF